MPPEQRAALYRFGVFELDTRTGELRHKGVRVRLHSQPLAVLCLLLERPGQMLTREEINRTLWTEGTFVDFEHGVNSAVNRLREALGDRAKNPRFVETLQRRGYRFIAPVERVETSAVSACAEAASEEAAATPAGAGQAPEVRVALPQPDLLGKVLAQPADLPETSPVVVRGLYLLLQGMYLAFYLAALANMRSIDALFSAFAAAGALSLLVLGTAVVLIPVRVFLVCAVLFRPPGLRAKLLRVWWGVLPFDLLWALAPFLLLQHLTEGLVLAAMAPLVYAPFAQRSLVLMGAGQDRQ